MAKEKKHEETDILTKIVGKIENFLITHLKKIIISISIVVVLLASFLILNNVLGKKEIAAESAFGKVYMTYKLLLNDENIQEKELKEKLLELAESFKAVMEEHPKTKAATKSAYYAGNIYFTYEEYEKALEYFKKGTEITRQKYYAVLLCYLGEATTYEQLGNYEKSEEIYRHIIEKYKDSFILPTVKFNLGQLYEKMNKIDEAREQYDSIISKYEWSSWSELAKKRILILKTKHS